MDFLLEPPPGSTIRADVTPGEFFSRCEVIAAANGWKAERKAGRPGPGYDFLKISLVNTRYGELTLEMFSTPSNPERIISDVSAHWSSNPTPCEEYVRTCKAGFSTLFEAYAERFKQKPRLIIGHCGQSWDQREVDPSKLEYARQKFHQAVRDMAVGAGDIRDRLLAAYSVLWAIGPEELPPPLSDDLKWIYRSLTSREPRFEGQGRVNATLKGMRNRSGVKIAKRILAIADALDELCGHGER